MFNMNPKKTPVKEQDGKERIKNFDESEFKEFEPYVRGKKFGL